MRHALAALALGWYLLLPPSETPDESDMRRWIHVFSHDTATDCQKSREEGIKSVRPYALEKKEPAERTQAVLGVVKASRCIATSDPRLSPTGGAPK